MHELYLLSFDIEAGHCTLNKRIVGEVMRKCTLWISFLFLIRPSVGSRFTSKKIKKGELPGELYLDSELDKQILRIQIKKVILKKSTARPNNKGLIYITIPTLSF